MVAQVEFWSDHIDAPKTIFRNLSNETIERRMREALDAHDGDGDLFAVRTVMDAVQWTTTHFCLVKEDGRIFEDQGDCDETHL